MEDVREKLVSVTHCILNHEVQSLAILFPYAMK